MEFDWLRGFAHFLRGIAFEDSGKYNLALKDYKEVLTMDRYYPEVEEARKRINYLMKNG